MQVSIRIFAAAFVLATASIDVSAAAGIDVRLANLLQATYGGSQRLLSGGLIIDDPTDEPLPPDKYNGRVLKLCLKTDADECVIRVRVSHRAGVCTVDVSSTVVIAQDASRKVRWHLRGDPGVVRFKPVPIEFLPDPIVGPPGFDTPVLESDRKASANLNTSTGSAVAYQIHVQRKVPVLGWLDCVPSDPVIVNQS